MKNIIKSKSKIIILAETILAFIIICTGLFMKEQGLKPIASESNSEIIMTKTDNILSQSWEADSKNITGIVVKISAQNSNALSGNLLLSLKEERSSEEAIASKIVSLDHLSGIGEYKINIGKKALKLGKRYYIELKITDCSEQTRLALKTNANYGGLFIGGEEARGAVAFDVTYEKPSKAAWLIQIFIIFSSITCFCMVQFNKKFEEVLALTFGGIFVYLYLFGIFNVLEFGVLSLLTISSAVFLSIPFLLAMKDKKLQDIISPGLVAFWSLFLIYFILDRNAVAGKVDDLNHWELCVRDMWYFDSFPMHEGTVVEFLRYTPGFATIEYLFTYLYGDFREGIVLLACHTIGFSFLSILYTKINWINCHKVIPVTVLLAGLPLLIYQSHYGILYVDAYLGILGAYMIICFFTEGKTLFNWLRITFASILLIMTKEMGLAIAATLYLVFLVDIWKEDCKWSIKLLFKNKSFWDFFKSGLLSLSIFLTWQGYIFINESKLGLGKNSNNIFKMFEVAKYETKNMLSSIQLASVADTRAFNDALINTVENTTVSDTGPLKIIKDMINWFFFGKEFIGGSYAELLLIVIALCMILGMAGLYKKLNIPMNKIIIYLIIGTFLYTSFLTFCYIFLFEEATSIPAARRYMGSYLLLFLTVVTGILIVQINKYEQRFDWKQPFVWGICIFIFLNIPDGHSFYTTEENFGPYFTTWKNHQKIGEVFRSFADKEEKIYYVGYKDSSLVPQYDYLTFFNAVVPNPTQGLDKGWKPVVDKENTYGQFTVEYTSKKWSDVLEEGYTYVYLMNIDEYFIKQYGSLFVNSKEIRDGNIYYVVKEGNKDIKLRQIAYMNLN